MTLPAATTTAHCEAVLDEIERVVVGKRSALTLILTAVLARGHVLIEDLPGLGKTLIARSFAAALGLQFTRVWISWICSRAVMSFVVTGCSCRPSRPRHRSACHRAAGSRCAPPRSGRRRWHSNATPESGSR